jgi:hypothetical protein
MAPLLQNTMQLTEASEPKSSTDLAGRLERFVSAIASCELDGLKYAAI